MQQMLQTIIPAIIAAAAAIITSWLSSHLQFIHQMRENKESELRTKTLLLLEECIDKLVKLRSKLTEFIHSAPRSGGRIHRPGTPYTEWEFLSNKETQDADRKSATLVGEIFKYIEEIENISIKLDIFGESSLRSASNSIKERIICYFEEIIDSSGGGRKIVYATQSENLLSDIDNLTQAMVIEAKNYLR